MVKTVIDNIIILSDETGDIHRMEKLVNSEELEEYINDCQKIINAKSTRKITFPCIIMRDNMIRYLRENNELAAMVRLELRHTGIIYSFGRLDEAANVHSVGFCENGFFVYEKSGIIYY